jgi:hypothetical protein
LPTTTRSSDAVPAFAVALALLLVLSGCTSASPAEYFRLEPQAPAYKAAQTRYFETHDADELLSASAAVLQDLGFHVEESGREVGFLRAAKERSARTPGEAFRRVAVMILSLGNALLPIDLEQRIAATLVARPTGAGSARQEVRIMFYRVVWKGSGAAGREAIPPGEQRMEMIRDPFVYQQFFAKLSKAVFLEAFTL